MRTDYFPENAHKGGLPVEGYSKRLMQAELYPDKTVAENLVS